MTTTHPHFEKITQAQVEQVELALRNAALAAGLDWAQTIFLMGLMTRALVDTAPNAHNITPHMAETIGLGAFKSGFESTVITINTTRQ